MPNYNSVNGEIPRNSNCAHLLFMQTLVQYKAMLSCAPTPSPLAHWHSPDALALCGSVCAYVMCSAQLCVSMWPLLYWGSHYLVSLAYDQWHLIDFTSVWWWQPEEFILFSFHGLWDSFYSVLLYFPLYMPLYEFLNLSTCDVVIYVVYYHNITVYVTHFDYTNCW